MDEQPTKAEVEAKLRGTSESIARHVEAIQGEVGSTRTSVKEFLREHPLLSVGGALAAGLLVGLVFGKSRRRQLKETRRALIEGYADTLREEVEYAVAAGKDVGTAVRDALYDRMPLVVIDQQQPKQSKGFWRRSLEVVFDAGLALLAREVIGAYLSDLEANLLEESDAESIEAGSPLEDHS